jgi:uncharacterized phage protein (TIGR02220 family)
MNENKQRYFVIPEIFFKALAGQKKVYGRLWFYWMSEFVDEIFEPDFLEKQILGLKKFSIATESEIKQVYEVGVHLLQQNDFKIVEQKGKKKRELKPLTDEMKKSAIAAIDYLNSKAGTTFSIKGNNLELAAARLKEGYSLGELKLVIDKKVQDWKGSDYSKYLRPLTLFAKSKFENYLNGTNEQQPAGKISKLADSVAKAQQLIEFYKQP